MSIKNKSFIITIDTEADNQWDLNHPITTENTKYLPRFQELCERYGFKPVWLTNYEMAMDDDFVSYMKPKQDVGLCEIGMHLHAWYTPPEYELAKVSDEREYLIEYPENIMDAKIATMTELITDRFGVKPVSHRAGRWAMDARYFKLLEKHGYLVDCSVTPGMDWSKHLGSSGIGGSNYTDSNHNPIWVGDKLLEVPLTIRKMHNFDRRMVTGPRSLFSETKNALMGKKQWLRQDNTRSSGSIFKLIEEVSKEDVDYLMFMIHSSELMPGGNPTFINDNDIEWLYGILEELFSIVKSLGYSGKSLSQYYYDYLDNMEYANKE